MEIIQIVGVAIVVTLLVLVLKEQKPVFAFMLAMFAGVLIFLSIVVHVSDVFRSLQDLAVKAKIEGIFFTTIIKIIGIAYITEFGAQITKDAGQGALASKIELAGKVLIMLLAVPIIITIIDTVIKLLPGHR